MIASKGKMGLLHARVCGRMHACVSTTQGYDHVCHYNTIFFNYH